MSKDSTSTILDTILLDQNGDIRIGFFLIAVGGLVAFVNYPFAILVGMGLGIYFTLAFLFGLLSGEKYFERMAASRSAASYSSGKSQFRQYKGKDIPQTSSAPIADEPTIAERIKAIHVKNDFKCPSCGATILPTDVKCKHCDSILVVTADLPRPEIWGGVEIGQSVQVKHPDKGDLNASVIYRVYHGELWQVKMKPDAPWTLTGNYYVGLGLENGMYLLNWQGRFYLLDTNATLTDKEINQTFAKPAREFAASNQSKDVRLIYARTNYGMEDIGRFRIEFAEGDGIKVSPGAVGPFIHAKRDNLALVVEDYQSGAGGVDNAWTGYQIAAKDIRF